LGSIVVSFAFLLAVAVVVAGVVFVVTVFLLSGCMYVCFYYCFTLICSIGYYCEPKSDATPERVAIVVYMAVRFTITLPPSSCSHATLLFSSQLPLHCYHRHPFPSLTIIPSSHYHFSLHSLITIAFHPLSSHSIPFHPLRRHPPSRPSITRQHFATAMGNSRVYGVSLMDFKKLREPEMDIYSPASFFPFFLPFFPGLIRRE
jgi:hypothetical protein